MNSKYSQEAFLKYVSAYVIECLEAGCYPDEIRSTVDETIKQHITKMLVERHKGG